MKNLLFSRIDNEVGIITINRPDVLNALNLETLNELFELLQDLRDKIRILIITGQGIKGFIAGADIKEMNALTPNEFSEFLILGQKITIMLEDINWITIAAVNGYALGGGAEIALACDLIFASQNAKLGLPEVKLGIIPGFGGTVRLGKRIPLNKAKEFIFKGEIITADQGYELGIINKVIPLENLLEETLMTAKVIQGNSLNAVLAAKESLNKSHIPLVEECLKIERDICGHCFTNSDRNEGMAAFIEKRSPHFNQ